MAPYREQSYAEVLRWMENTEIAYVPHGKKGGTKSAERYDKYSQAKVVKEALELGSKPLDLVNDLEKKLLKRTGGPVREQPLDLLQYEDTTSLSETDLILARFGYLLVEKDAKNEDGQDGEAPAEKSDAFQKKKLASKEALCKAKLSAKFGVKAADLAQGTGWAESPSMVAQRSRANVEAARLLEVAEAEGRGITDDDVLRVLRLWAIRRNGDRKNVMPEGVKWVHCETVGLLHCSGGRLIATLHSKQYPKVLSLFAQWLKDNRPEGHTRDFPFTSIIINSGYAGRRHRDHLNVGPTVVKAFGDFEGGLLRYWPDDTKGTLELLQEEASTVLDIHKKPELIDGNRAHMVEPYTGDERFSLVFFTTHAYERTPPEDQDILVQLGIPFPDEEALAYAKGLLPAPKGHAYAMQRLRAASREERRPKEPRPPKADRAPREARGAGEEPVKADRQARAALAVLRALQKPKAKKLFAKVRAAVARPPAAERPRAEGAPSAAAGPRLSGRGGLFARVLAKRAAETASALAEATKALKVVPGLKGPKLKPKRKPLALGGLLARMQGTVPLGPAPESPTETAPADSEPVAKARPVSILNFSKAASTGSRDAAKASADGEAKPKPVSAMGFSKAASSGSNDAAKGAATAVLDFSKAASPSSASSSASKGKGNGVLDFSKAAVKGSAGERAAAAARAEAGAAKGGSEVQGSATPLRKRPRDAAAQSLSGEKAPPPSKAGEDKRASSPKPGKPIAGLAPRMSKLPYREESYAEVLRWMEETEIEYVPHGKKAGTKSYDRYEKYSQAKNVKQALELGSKPLDLVNDLEKKLLKQSGGPIRDKPLDLLQHEDTTALTQTDLILGRWGYVLGFKDLTKKDGEEGEEATMNKGEAFMKKKLESKEAFRKAKLSAKFGVKAEDIVKGTGWAESPAMVAQRCRANVEAGTILDEAAAAGRGITDEDVLRVLRLWVVKKNADRKNVMPEGVTWVHCETIGLLHCSGGRLIATLHCKQYPKVLSILAQWMKDNRPEGHSKDFPFTSIIVNSGYAARRHRDHLNLGPTVVKAFGDFEGGQLRYWADDAKLTNLELLREEDAQVLDVRATPAFIDGNRAHMVEPYVGNERYSLVFFTAQAYERTPEDDRDTLLQLGIPFTNEKELSDARRLLKVPRGYSSYVEKPGAPPLNQEELQAKAALAVLRALQTPKKGKMLSKILRLRPARPAPKVAKAKVAKAKVPKPSAPKPSVPKPSVPAAAPKFAGGGSLFARVLAKRAAEGASARAEAAKAAGVVTVEKPSRFERGPDGKPKRKPLAFGGLLARMQGALPSGPSALKRSAEEDLAADGEKAARL